jgi:hypothetical protein
MPSSPEEAYIDLMARHMLIIPATGEVKAGGSWV